MSLYQDVMDQSRKVQPIETKGRKVLCRVYFNGHYTGKVELSIHLLQDKETGKQMDRIGFLLVA